MIHLIVTRPNGTDIDRTVYPTSDRILFNDDGLPESIADAIREDLEDSTDIAMVDGSADGWVWSTFEDGE